MSKFDKFKQIFDIAAPIAGAAIPGLSVLNKVNAALNGHTSPASPASSDALKALAEDNDEQTKAIISMFEYCKKLEARIAELENK